MHLRGFVNLSAVVVAAAVGVPSAAALAAPGPSAAALAAPGPSAAPRWDVRQHPGPPDAKVRSVSTAGVSCASATHCVSVGDYTSVDPSQPHRLFLTTVDPTTGQTEAVAAPLPADVGRADSLELSSVSCGGLQCVAVGSYETVEGVQHPMVETQVRNDRWSVNALEGVTGFAQQVACNPQACVLTGYHTSTTGVLIITRSATTGWTRRHLDLPAGETGPEDVQPACPAEGTCIASAVVHDDAGTVPVLLYPSGSRWIGSNFAIPSGVDAATVSVGSMACTSTANCVAFGSYDLDPFRGDTKLFAEILHDGVLRAVHVVLPPDARASPGITARGVSCGNAADPRCVVIAHYGADDPEEGQHGTALFVVRDGVVSSRPATTYSTFLYNVSCFAATSRTDCVAVGHGGTTIPVATYRAGGWSLQDLTGRPRGIPHSPPDWSASLTTVSCAAGSCLSGGGWTTLDQGQFPHASGALLGRVSGID